MSEPARGLPCTLLPSVSATIRRLDARELEDVMTEGRAEEQPVGGGLGDRERYRQRRRKQRSDGETSVRLKHKEIEEAFDLVPVAGDGYRWYDYPHMVLWWLAHGWRAKILRGRIRQWIFKGINFLSAFNNHDRDKAWSLEDPHHNVFVPEDEHVNVAGIWIVELFPPTELPGLERAIRRNGWDRSRFMSFSEEGNQKTLEKARTGGGDFWWRLVDVVGRKSTWFVPDGVRDDLPPEFGYVEMRAIQVGTGLTAVIAHFHLTEDAATMLDKEWHRQHEPFLQRRNGRLRSLDRHWGTFWKVQSERRRLHYAARDWLAERVPGFFATNAAPSPLLDLLMFDKLDPTESQPDSSNDEKSRQDELQLADALRALGIHEPSFDMLVSHNLPKLVLSHLEGRMDEALGEAPTWSLWGSRPAVVAALNEGSLKSWGENDNRAIANRLVQNMYNLFVMLAVSHFLAVTERRFAAIRDRATKRHGKFKPKALDEMRNDLLTHSLNLASVRRDVAAFWGRPWRWGGDAEFFWVQAPRQRARKQEDETEREPASFNAAVRENHEKAFERLAESDREYRDILSTVASLGASADTYRMARIALVVAVASMGAAVAAVLVVDVGPDSLWSKCWEAISGWLGD